MRAIRSSFHFLQLGLVLLVSLLGAVADAGGQTLDSQINAFLEESVRSSGIPGLTAAVVRDGNVIYVGAFGVRELGTDELLTPEHVFHFASIAKPFVATAILQLAEEGKLDIDDFIVKHVPYFRVADERYQEITIRQMLNHTSGMPDVEDYEWDNPQFDEGAAERYVRTMASEELLWAPGNGWMYSNMAFDALGDLIAKVSGVSFEEYVQINILEPIGMNNSSFVYAEIDEDLRTTGHAGNPARVSDVYPYNRRHAPSSTLSSNVIDMTRWMNVNLARGELDGQPILGAVNHDRLMVPSTELITDEETFDVTLCQRADVRCGRIGLSWFLGEYHGHRTAYHGGNDPGFHSYILLLPDAEIGIVLASNWQETDRTTLAYGVLDLILAFGDG